MARSTARGILIVDDHDDARELLAEFLMHEGYHTIMAANGRAALDRLAYVQPDLIISDLEMPEMDGVELVRHLRAAPALAPIPVIVLTSFDTESARQRLGDLVSNVRVILRKPVKLGAMLQVVVNCLGPSASD